jgi:hypothetical protein
MSERIEITDSDKLNPLWPKMLSLFEQRIEKLRRDNDGDRTEIETAKLRGRIAELRYLVALNAEKPVIE